MKHTKACLLASVAFAAMAASAQADQFINGGFEDGTLNGWMEGGGQWTNGPVPVPADYLVGGKAYVPGSAINTITNAGDYDLNTGFRLSEVYAGAHSIKINNTYPDQSVSVISQRVNNYTDSHISFAFAAVLEASHGPLDSDAFIVTLTDATTNKVLYTYNINSATAPGLFTKYTTGSSGGGISQEFFYSQWMPQFMNVKKFAGHDFILSILANDCPYGAHAGYAYLDGIGAMLPLDGAGLQYWNGSTTVANGKVNGGSGEWSATNGNWTTANGAGAGPYAPAGGGPVFQGAPGVVTVNNKFGQVAISAATFLTDGYVVNGNSIALNAGAAWISVGDGTDADRSNITTTINAPIIGTGALSKLGNGALILNGLNTYTGGTTADSGVLIGSATSFGAGAITIYDRLVIDQPTKAVFANTLSGWGTFEKRGAGTLALTGTSDFWGDTQVTSGALQVDGSLASSVVTVNPGGRLTGSGTVGGVIAPKWGIVAPGPGYATLKVAGDYQQDAGSTLQIAVSSAGENSAIHATGAANFTGGAILDVVRQDKGSWLDRKYTYLTADGGITGTPIYDGQTRVSMFYDLSLSQDKTHAYFSVLQTTPFDAVAQTRNQRAAAEGIDSVAAGNARPLYDTIGYMNAASEARAAFDVISGEAYASARTVLIEDSRLVRDAFALRLNDAEDSDVAASMPLGYAPSAHSAFPLKDEGSTVVGHSAAWIQGFDSWGSTKSDGNAQALKRQTGGLLLGYDTLLGDTVRVGLGGGFSQTAFDVTGRSSKGGADNFHIGVYAGTRLNGWGVKVGAAWTASSLTVNRNAAFAAPSNTFSPNFANTLTGRGHDSTGQVFGDLSYRVHGGGAYYEPFDNFAYVSVNSDPFTEKGGAAALHGVSNDTQVAFNTIGVRAAYATNVGAAVSTVRGELGWKHAFGDITPQQALQFTAGSIFTVYGAPVAEDAMAVKGAVDVALTDQLSLTARYDAQFAKSANDQSVKGAMGYRF